MSAAFAEGGRQRILEQGMALSGLESAPQQAELLLDLVVDGVTAWCGRSDVPREMERCVALLLSRVLKDGVERPVSVIKRGDTAITYGDGDVRAMLEPFVRLKSPAGKAVLQ